MQPAVNKLVSLFCGFLIVGSTFAQTAQAGSYTCPAANLINCIPASPTVGPWVANGGQMTGNTFAPNNQCANVIQLNPQEWRLVCCYTKCGVFLQDVRANKCEKIGESHFRCL